MKPCTVSRTILIVVALLLLMTSRPIPFAQAAGDASRFLVSGSGVQWEVTDALDGSSGDHDADSDGQGDGRLRQQAWDPSTLAAHPLTPQRPLLSITIGGILTGSYTDAYNRFTALGYTVSSIPAGSGIDTFRLYDIVLLPVNWAHPSYGSYATIEAHAQDYRTYVEEGGGLMVGQPNPDPGGTEGEYVTPSLLPHPITFYSEYERDDDFPPTVVDPNHPITLGLPPEDLPFPADRMTSVDPFYDVLVVGRTTGSASLVVGQYGKGRIVVETAHPNLAAVHPVSDTAYRRMFEWVSEKPDAWPTAYAALYDDSSEVQTYRQFRDEIISGSAMGKVYTAMLYRSSGEALQVLLENPALMSQARYLAGTNEGALIDVLAGKEGVVDNVDEIATFLDAFAEKSPPSLAILAHVVKREMLSKQKQDELLFGFRLR